MPSSLSFTAQDRVMVMAPHPDDESLGTGGLLQRALRSGAQVRVVFATDGENNPWPQRLLERRWRIGEGDRLRWGAQRRQEALAAMDRLGLREEMAQFLHLPDQGASDLLLHADEHARRTCLEAISNWRPTLVVTPSWHDVHPDHNAFSILILLALECLHPASRPRLLHYVVHTRGRGLPTPRLSISLTESEREAKRTAILCHRSQMALSRRRFLAYARDVEHFFAPKARDPKHPIRSVGWEDGALCVRLRPLKLPLFRGELWMAGESPFAGNVRWRLPLRSGPARVCIHDAANGGLLRSATVRSTGGVLEVRLPLAPISDAGRLFLKFNRRLGFYDEAGWLEVPIPVQAQKSCFDRPLSATSSSSSSSVAWFSGGGSGSSA